MTDLSLSPPGFAGLRQALETALNRPRSLLLVFLAALVGAAAVRAPFLSVEGLDDSFYTEVGHLWAKGLPPYLYAYDVKPPGFFALVALAQKAVGPSLLALRLVSIVSDAITSTALFGLGRRCGSTALGLFAAMLYPVLSLTLHGSEAYTPLEAATALTMLAALSDFPLVKRAALAGVCAGAAFTFKQTAALEAAVAFGLLVSSAQGPRARLFTGLTFLAAASLAPLGFLAYFAWQGAAGPLIDQAIVAALLRPSSAAVNLTFADGLSRFFPLQRSVLWLMLAAIFALGRWRAIREATPTAPLGALAAWMVAGCLSVLLQRSMTITYLGPMIAPLLLLAGLGVTAGLPMREKYPDAVRLLALAAASIVMAIAIPGAHLSIRAPEEALARAADIVRRAGAMPGDKLLVVNRGVLLNAMLDLDPPTKVIFTAHALCDFAAESPQWLTDELTAKPRFIVVANRHRGAVCELRERWAQVDAALADDYAAAGHAEGPGESFDVFERRGL